MGNVVQISLKSLEKLGLTPGAILILTVMVLLFTWLFKQVSLRQEKLLEEEKAETQETLNQYCNIYKTLLLFKEDNVSKEALLIEYSNSIPFLKTKTFEKLENLLFNDQPIEEIISHLKEQIQILRNEQDELNPRYDRGTTSGRIGNILRTIEVIFQPIFVTMLAFASFLYLMYVGIQPIIGLNTRFLTNVTILLNSLLFLSFFAAIVDKRFNYSVRNSGVILGYLAIIIALLLLNHILASLIAIILFFVFTTFYNPKINNGR